jgi:hypothetical protein
MATTIRQELEEEFLSTIRTGQEIALDALKPLVGVVHYIIPTMPVVRLPLGGLVPTAHEAVADGYEFAERLLADQRHFADELITATSPLRPGRTRPEPVAAKAAETAKPAKAAA